MGGFTFNCGKISTSLWDALNATCMVGFGWTGPFVTSMTTNISGNRLMARASARPLQESFAHFSIDWQFSFNLG